MRRGRERNGEMKSQSSKNHFLSPFMQLMISPVYLYKYLHVHNYNSTIESARSSVQRSL